MARQHKKYFAKSYSEDTDQWSKNHDRTSNKDVQKENKELFEKIEDLKLTIASQKVVLQELNSKNEAYYNENLQLKERITKIEKEKEEALSRISKLAGEQLANGNPAISDLSNPYRPAKIGEKWRSLYSDEWTDAYEDMKKRCKEKDEPEKELMRITTWCYQECMRIAEKQIEVINTNLRSAVGSIYMLDFECDTPRNDQLCISETGKVDGIVASTIEQVRNLRQTSSMLAEAATHMCIAEYKKNNPSTSPYEMNFVMKCLELCWCMCISSPQMVIEFENFNDKTIDSSKFNLYSRTGNIVEFVVWPVLLLHADGPVLAKGTVQTISEWKNLQKM